MRNGDFCFIFVPGFKDLEQRISGSANLEMPSKAFPRIFLHRDATISGGIYPTLNQASDAGEIIRVYKSRFIRSDFAPDVYFV